MRNKTIIDKETLSEINNFFDFIKKEFKVDFLGKGHQEREVSVRQLVIYYLRENFPLTMNDIAELMKRHRSTIFHAYNKACFFRGKDKIFIHNENIIKKYFENSKEKKLNEIILFLQNQDEIYLNELYENIKITNKEK